MSWQVQQMTEAVGTLVNGMLAVLMAKFIVNDLPHAAGLLANPSGYPTIRKYEEPGQIDSILKYSPELHPAFNFLELYALIAEEKATGQHIEEAFSIACSESSRLLQLYEDIDPTELDEYRAESYRLNMPRLKKAEEACREAKTRADKVILVDSLAGTVHYMVTHSGGDTPLPLPFGIDPEDYDAQMAVHRILGTLGVGEIDWREIYRGK